MRAMVKKWGNSAAVRLPASVMEAARLQLDQAVDVREENGRIVIDPVRAPVHEIESLLDAITPETLHGETDWGSDTGRQQL